MKIGRVRAGARVRASAANRFPAQGGGVAKRAHGRDVWCGPWREGPCSESEGGRGDLRRKNENRAGAGGCACAGERGKSLPRARGRRGEARARAGCVVRTLERGAV